MLPSLFAALVPALTPPLLPSEHGAAVVGVHVERTRLVAQNFSSEPRWLVLRNDACAVTRALAPHSAVAWEFSEPCLWDVDVQVVAIDAGGLHFSPRVELLGLLEVGGHALWVGEDSSSWLEDTSELVPLCADESTGPAGFPRTHKDPGPLHVPVVRPSDRPEGDKPPHIDDKPLPPI